VVLASALGLVPLVSRLTLVLVSVVPLVLV